MTTTPTSPATFTTDSLSETPVDGGEVGLVDQPAEARCLVGVARRDITPPFGIYGPVWGFSTHDGSSRGTHRPLLATALALQPEGGPQAVLIAVDLGTTGDLAGLEDLWLRQEIAGELDISLSHLMLASSHTHGAPWAFRSREDLPGGHLIEAYLGTLRDALVEAAREAVATAEDCIMTFRAGRCDLAQNRNLIDPVHPTRYLTGYNPAHRARADDTVMVGRVCRTADGSIKATVVNYACHPTTLGGDNRLVSPDYVGAMREVVESHTEGAPCLFLQGASGDLAPAHQYVADTAVADRHGRRLGYAALSTLLGMTPAGERLTYVRPIESGAPLAYWEPRSYDVPAGGSLAHETVGLPAKDWPGVAQLDEQLAATQDFRLRERLLRKRTIAVFTDGRGEVPTEVYAWRFGRLLFVGISCEIDVAWQQAVRERFPDDAVIAMSDVNYSAVGYVVSEDLCELNLYQAWQAPYAPGSYTALLDHTLRLGGSPVT